MWFSIAILLVTKKKEKELYKEKEIVLRSPVCIIFSLKRDTLDKCIDACAYRKHSLTNFFFFGGFTSRFLQEKMRDKDACFPCNRRFNQNLILYSNNQLPNAHTYIPEGEFREACNKFLFFSCALIEMRRRKKIFYKKIKSESFQTAIKSFFSLSQTLLNYRLSSQNLYKKKIMISSCSVIKK